MKQTLIKCWNWLWNRNKRERKDNAIKVLLLSARTTAKCRYKAANRLDLQSGFAFVTTIGLSLGLIFIALIQNSGVSLAFKSNVLNMMQIFFSVAVLVYSVVISTAHYEIRSAQLRECGNKLKELVRDIQKEQENSSENKKSDSLLTDFQQRYSNILTFGENHIDNDYLSVTLSMSLEHSRDYVFTGIPFILKSIQAIFFHYLGCLLPIILLVIEFLFICDMVGATSIFTDYLNGNAVAFKLAK
jgi:hypothetical protein